LVNFSNITNCYLLEITDPDQIGVKALDDKTLEIQINYPANYFLGYLQMVCFMLVNQKWAEQRGEAFGTEAETVIYNGPFVVKDWAHEQSMTLERNPDYRNKDAISKSDMITITLLFIFNPSFHFC